MHRRGDHAGSSPFNPAGRFGAFVLAVSALSISSGSAGCTGLIGEGSDPSSSDEPAVDVLGSPDFRRLSSIEVEQTLDDILLELGIAAAADDLLLAPPDVRYSFSNTADSGNFTTSQIQSIMTWAESVSALFVQDAPAVLGCTPSPAWDECVSGFASRLGRLTFRRPLAPEELATFKAVYERAMEQPEQPTDGVRALVELAFESPNYWYLSNETRPDSRQLTSYAIAGRLSYFLWGSMPDAALRDAADRDELSTPEQVRAQAERLLDDPRAEVVITRFHREWLHVDSATSLSKNAAIYPSFDPALAADMDREFDMYVERAVSQGSVQDLLAGRETFVNTRLETLFGVSASSSGTDDWVLRPLDDRAGILGRPLFLANTAGQGESSLVHRGVAVIEKYLCKKLEAPPDIADEILPIPPDATSGKMAAVEDRASKAKCSACHNTIDPIGISFEVFDAIGAYRGSYPDGVSIDPSGELAAGIVPTAISYTSSAELLTALASQPQAQACYASRWVEWSTGHRPTGDAMHEVERVAEQGPVSIRALLLEIATSPLLTHREDF
ncbi:MAG: DUF1592 domain-containing protein [Polyangiaceae bacterium]|nr:DUF1592 domain-containing protein [Polyangiaceae bacterium]